MRHAVLGAAVVLGATQAAPALPIQLDIDSTQGGTSIITQPGFTSYDATQSANGEGSAVFDAVTLTLFGGLDGSRNRPTGGGGPFDSLLRDFVFNDGGGAAVGLRLQGLEPGTYDVQSFHYDAGAGITGNFQIEVREQGVAGSTVILHDNVPMSVEPYAYQITVAQPGQTLELVFREDDDLNRSRLNGIIITPEPSSAGLLLLAAPGLLARRRRRPAPPLHTFGAPGLFSWTQS